MSQNDYNIANQGFPATRSDLNSALQALASCSSGATEPATMYANQLWYDTTASVLKIRNEANSAWISYINQDVTTTSNPTFANITTTGIDDNATSTAITIDASENVGIGTSSPSFASGRGVVIHNPTGASDTRLRLTNAAQGAGIYDGLEITLGADGSVSFIGWENQPMKFLTNGSQRMQIDASGNLLVGKTTTSLSTAGTAIRGDNAGLINSARNGVTLELNRLSTDGDIQEFFKDGSTVGSIGNSGNDLYINGLGTNASGIRFVSNQLRPRSNGSDADNIVNLGGASFRYNDIYATNNVINTSDRNEKQDIAVMDAAETRVAVACKGLFRKFRWKNAVADKGYDARIHFGIIAQDLQDAFTAEGLDAGRYAMFISSTWWEIEVVVPAVEAVAEVLDEDENVVTEAVDAVDAYTRTDTFNEVTEGATERTRLGVRYPELLAFIIGAI